MYHASYDRQLGQVVLTRNGEYWFAIPAAVSVNGKIYSPALSSDESGKLIFHGENIEISFIMQNDCIEVYSSITFDVDTPIYEAIYFRNHEGGMKIGHFDRSLTTQPRRNSGHNMDFYRTVPDCSLNGYFYPTILNFAIGNAQGFAAFGLLDLPDSYQYKLLDDGGILVESCGGNKIIPAGEPYRMPRMLITFPECDWDCIPLFRKKLMDYGLYKPEKKMLSDLPAWWRDPLVCTYGDELSTLLLPDVKMNDPRFNADWVRMLVDTAEKNGA